METLPDHVHDEYMYGHCMWLALHLHERFGWPIYAEFLDEGHRCLDHMFVRHPNGQMVDIRGVRSLEAIITGAGYVTRLTIAEVWDVVSVPVAFTDVEVAAFLDDARDATDRYLLPILREIGVQAALAPS